MPAEDTLTYKVELDAADLPQQLEQLRAQMDTAVGAMAFSNAPLPPEMTASPMNFMFDTAPTNAAQHMIDSTSAGFLATNQMMTTQEGGGLMNFLNSNVEAFRLGYAKFHGGMERMGLMVPPAPLVQFPPQGVTAYTEQMETLQGLGYPGGPLFTATGMMSSAGEMPGLVSGALGMGYDPNTMPYSRFEFQEMYGEAAGKRLGRTLEGNMFGLGGAGIGAVVGGPGGALVGGGIGMAADALVGMGGARRRQGEQVGAALRKISQRSNMQDAFTQEEGEGLANELLGQADTYESRINRVTRDSIQSQLLDFTREGGFDSARTADEFKQTAQGVIDNTRKVMQSLRMTQEEATKFMAEMNREGLVSTTDVSGFAMGVQANAQVAGMAPTEMLNFMKQGSEAFRGSAYGMGGGMQMLQEARLSTQQLLQTAGSGQDIVRELGGAQQATMGLAQSNANFMQSAMGMIGYNNMMQGGASGDTMSMMANTYGMSPFDWYRERARMSGDVASGAVSQQDIASMRLDPFMERYQNMFQRVEGRGMGADDYEGMFHYMTQAGITQSVAEAQQLFSTRFQDPAETSDRRIEALNAQMDRLRQPQPVTVGDQIRATMGGIGDAFMAPLRQLDESIHGIFDPIGDYLTDTITGRRELVDVGSRNMGHTVGAQQQHVALRAAAGNLSASEQAVLDKSLADYEEHMLATGGILNNADYRQYDIKRDGLTGEEAFTNRQARVSGDLQSVVGTLSPQTFTLPLTPSETKLSSLVGGNFTANVNTVGLHEALGEDFVFGELPTERLAGLFGNQDISGIDSLIVGQMITEGTLSSEGVLMNTRGNRNNNPVNIRVPDLATAEKYYGEYGVAGLDEHNFVQFTTLNGGMNAARQEALASVRKNQTILEFFHEQSPVGDDNDPDAMAQKAGEIIRTIQDFSNPEESIAFMSEDSLHNQYALLNNTFQSTHVDNIRTTGYQQKFDAQLSSIRTNLSTSLSKVDTPATNFLKEFANDMASTFIDPDELNRTKHLAQFVTSMGGGDVMLGASNLGIRGGANAESGLYNHGRNLMMYNTFASYNANEIAAHVDSSAFQEVHGAKFEGYTRAVGAALTVQAGSFENEMVDRLNVAATVLHQQGVVSHNNIAEIEDAGQLELIRNVSYYADQGGYYETFSQRGDGSSSLAEYLAVHGKDYGNTITPQMGDDGTYSPQVRALNRSIGILEANLDTNLDDKSIKANIRGLESFKALQGTSSWRQAAMGDDDFFTSIGVGLMGVGGAGAVATGWTGIGAAVSGAVFGIGAVMAGTDQYEAYENANTTHLAKIMHRMRLADESMFMNNADMEERYNTSDIDQLGAENINDMFIRTIAFNQTDIGNDFVTSMQGLTEFANNNSGTFDAGVVGHLKHATSLAHDVQAQLTKVGFVGQGSIIEELSTMRGIRAGLQENTSFQMYHGATGGDAGTYEQMNRVRDQLIAEQKKKGEARTVNRAVLDRLHGSMIGVDRETILEGRKDSQGNMVIPTFLDFAKMTNMEDNDFDGADLSKIKPHQLKAYEEEVARTELGIMQGAYGISKSVAKEYGLDTMIQNKMQDDKNLETIRSADLNLNDAEDQQVALLMDQNRKLETLILTIKEGNMN